jgi:histidine decarboxylase
MNETAPFARRVPAMLREGIDHAALDAEYARLREACGRFLGYPVNLDHDYSPLARFLEFSLNNVGDPFQHSPIELNSLDFEREVIECFEWLAGCEPGDSWGYVTGGGTEGNMYGLYLARELLPDGMVYFSQETHYSVMKVLRLQHMPNIMLRSLPNGELDYEDLEASLRVNRHIPPIIFANIGTTMKGAIDNLDRIREVLERLALPLHYIHADAALHGFGLAFLDNPPPWNFTAGIDSISISGHKWLGSPIPCGIALAKRHHVERVARSVEYVNLRDTTIAGSRNGLTPLILWYGLRKHGLEGLRALVRRCLETAEHAVAGFRQLGFEAWRNPCSPIVVFPRPPEPLRSRWCLAPQGRLSHLVCMGHVTPQMIDRFLEEYRAAMVHPTS